MAEELRRRFGLPLWQFTLSATDANRHVIRYARHVTGRRKIVVHDYCYHGSVDETFADAGRRRADRRRGAATSGRRSTRPRRPGWSSSTTSTGLERALASGEVAAVLAEPALTNVGIVLPEPGYHDALRELTRRYDVLLVIDETHTLSAGPGGYTGAHGLQPDLMTMGKAIAGGIPAGAFGMTAEVADRIDAVDRPRGHRRRRHRRHPRRQRAVAGRDAGDADRGADRRGLRPDAAAGRPLGRRRRRRHRARTALPWHCTRLGARGGVHLHRRRRPGPAPRRTPAGTSPSSSCCTSMPSTAGILLTPFHNMALMSPGDHRGRRRPAHRGVPRHS